jgi:DHA2 family multidrug resistance protein
VGPTLGGWLTENYNWRWVFLINVPFGILATLGLITFLKETSFNKAVRLDWTGFAALSIGVGALQTLLDRGQTQDWFNSPEIQIEAILCGLGFYIFLTHSLLTPKPFLSPRLFKDLNFLAAILIMFVLGLILFATMALMAPYLQLMMNYPVSTAGLLMAPRGAGAMLCALFCGRILGRVSARKLVFAGFLTSIYSLYAMTHWTPDISDWTIIQVGFIQGIGTSLISVPLSTVGFSTLPAELRAEGAGIFSLMRNLGSSIGISVTAALLESNTQVNHAILSAGVTPFDRALQSGGPLAFWNPGSTLGAAALDAMITQQSSVIAYVDDFKLMLIFAIVTTPLVLLLHSGRPIIAPPRAAAE